MGLSCEQGFYFFTHGFSFMTLHTEAMVLSVSVAFCRVREGFSWRSLEVAPLSVLSMGVGLA